MDVVLAKGSCMQLHRGRMHGQYNSMIEWSVSGWVFASQFPGSKLDKEPSGPKGLNNRIKQPSGLYGVLPNGPFRLSKTETGHLLGGTSLEHPGGSSPATSCKRETHMWLRGRMHTAGAP